MQFKGVYNERASDKKEAANEPKEQVTKYQARKSKLKVSQYS